MDVQQWYMQKVLFYYEDFVYQATELQAMLSTNRVHAEDTCPSVTGFICAKCQNYNICM